MDGKKEKAARLIAASAESLNCLYLFPDRLRFCTSAASGNQKRPNGMEVLNRVMGIPYFTFAK
jgi:hypothetical protein